MKSPATEITPPIIPVYRHNQSRGEKLGLVGQTKPHLVMAELTP